MVVVVDVVEVDVDDVVVLAVVVVVVVVDDDVVVVDDVVVDAVSSSPQATESRATAASTVRTRRIWTSGVGHPWWHLPAAPLGTRVGAPRRTSWLSGRCATAHLVAFSP